MADDTGICIVDSGASHVLVRDKQLLRYVYRNRTVDCRVADSRIVRCSVGILWENSLGLREALYMPTLSPYMLIAVSSLEDGGAQVRFGPDTAEKILRPARSGNLYTMDFRMTGSGRRENTDTGGDLQQHNNNGQAINLGRVKSINGSAISSTNNLYQEDLFCPDADEYDIYYGRSTIDEFGTKRARERTQELVFSAEALKKHFRQAHFHIPGMKMVNCPVCPMFKGRGQGHLKMKKAHHQVPKWGDLVVADFIGPFPQSHSGRIWALITVDSATKWVEGFSCSNRSEAGDKLRLLIQKNGIPRACRADNAKEFREPGSGWMQVMLEFNIQPYFSIPYHPQTNGLCERNNQTIQNGVACVLAHTDKRFWDWALGYVIFTWNRTPGKDGESSYSRRYGRHPNTSFFRTFGCLAFVKDFDRAGKVDPKFRPGVFLGYSPINSAWLIGHWVADARYSNSGGMRFRVDESVDVVFYENILVKNSDDLLPDRIYDLIPNVPKRLGESDLSKFQGDAPAPEPEAIALQDKSASGGDGPLKNGTHGEFLPDGNAPAVIHPSPSGPDLLEKDQDKKRKKTDPTPVKTDVDQKSKKSKPSGIVEKTHPGEVLEKEVVKKKRGRKPGTKPKSWWKKPGPKSKTDGHARGKQSARNKAKAKAKLIAEDVGSALLSQIDKSVDDYIDKLKKEYLETPYLYTIQVTKKEAFEGPNSVKWLEADSLERAQLEAMGCWRPIKNGEFTSSDELIPSVVVYTKKRCGKFKARLVALGNRQKSTSASEIYSPTISYVAMRVTLVDAAAKGHYISVFDISNAFISAILNTESGDPGEERVFVRLPDHWAEKSDINGKPRPPLVRLLKSLYGLKISPRKWYDCYASFLKEAGWQCNPEEPGLWRKAGLLLCIYVDDSIICGPCKITVLREQDVILQRFPGKVIHPISDGKWKVWDMLGAQVRFCRAEKSLKIDMKNAIDALLEKFAQAGARIYSTPCVNNKLNEGDRNEKFPIRSLVGALQHIGNMARPDIVYAVQRVARNVTPFPTESTVAAAKRILGYLRGTRERGISYTPEGEEKFKNEMYEIAEKSGKQDLVGDVLGFGDSDFAGCSVTFRSTSGSILYYRSCPVVWRASRQSIRSYSTCEAEYIALYDTLVLTKSLGFRNWFLEEKELPLVFCDNQSALKISQNSLPTKKSKHYMLRLMLVRENYKSLAYVPTDKNRADPLTKGVTADKYIQLFDAGYDPAMDDDVEESVYYSQAHFSSAVLESEKQDREDWSSWFDLNYVVDSNWDIDSEIDYLMR